MCSILHTLYVYNFICCSCTQINTNMLLSMLGNGTKTEAEYIIFVWYKHYTHI